MYLKTQLEGGAKGRLAPVLKFPAQPLVAHARKALQAKFSAESVVPAQEQLDQLARRLREAAQRAAWGDITPSDWRRAAWCLWLPGYELANSTRFFETYLARVRQRHRRSAYSALVGVYLREYRPDDKAFNLVAEAIREIVDAFQWPWARRHREYSLFWPHRGANTLAEALLAAPSSVSKTLEQAGLAGELSRGAFAQSVYCSVLGLLKQRLGVSGVAPEELNQVLAWMADGNRLRFPGTEGPLADALLGNWRASDPDESIRSATQEFLMRTLGDPRIKGAGRWLGVAEEDKRVLLRWLVGASLEQFLQIVDKVAQPSHWEYRRAFWGAYHEAGVIEEAWVVFGRRGYDIARRSFRDSVGYAQLSGGEQTHAVLLLRIGELTIADWSHNGTCRIWTASNRHKPIFYGTHYARGDLVAEANFSQMHHGSDRGTWQGAVADYIRSRTGIVLRRAQYMPR